MQGMQACESPASWGAPDGLRERRRKACERSAPERPFARRHWGSQPSLVLESRRRPACRNRPLVQHAGVRSSDYVPWCPGGTGTREPGLQAFEY
eukprot:10158910-Alexandrium_andersonii.AAC.1